MSPKAYKAGRSRYNVLNIKRTTIDIVNELKELELINFIKGERFSQRVSYVSCISASDKLIKTFQDTAFLEFVIGHLFVGKSSKVIMCIQS